MLTVPRYSSEPFDVPALVADVRAFLDARRADAPVIRLAVPGSRG